MLLEINSVAMRVYKTFKKHSKKITNPYFFTLRHSQVLLKIDYFLKFEFEQVYSK